jgi:hypothetical protein
MMLGSKCGATHMGKMDHCVMPTVPTMCRQVVSMSLQMTLCPSYPRGYGQLHLGWGQVWL